MGLGTCWELSSMQTPGENTQVTEPRGERLHHRPQTPVWDPSAPQCGSPAQTPAGGWGVAAPTQELDDVGMVEVLHARCFAEELFYLPLGKVVHWETEEGGGLKPQEL